MNRTKYLVKNVGILAASNFASKILVLLLVPLYTSVLSSEEVGLYDIVVSSVGLVFPLLTLNIVDALMRFLMDKSKSKEEVVSIAFRVVTISVAIVALFLIISTRFEVFHAFRGYEIYIFVFYLFSSYYSFFVQLAKGLELVSVMGVASVIGTATTLTFNIVLLVGYRMGLQGFFIANILGQVFPISYFAIRTKVWRHINCKINKALKEEMLLYCMPLIATAVSWWVNSTADKYVVSFVCGLAATGILSVSYKIPAIINTLQGIFIQAWQISAIKEYGKDSSKFYGKAFKTLNMFMVVSCSGLIILNKVIARLLFRKEFFAAWQYVPFLLISCVFNCAAGMLGPILSARKESKPMAMSAVCGVISNIVLNILLTILIGVQGAVIATAFSSYVIYQVRKHAVKGELYIERYPVVVLTWVLLCVQAFLEIYTTLWWIEVAILLAIFFLYRADIMQMFGMIKGIIASKEDELSTQKKG